MKWMLGVMLALGLGGCSKLDNTKVSGDGAVIEQRHPLGQQVTRVLAGVPANISLSYTSPSPRDRTGYRMPSSA